MWQWREPFDSLLWLACGGIVGTLARMALVELFRCYSTAVPGAGGCRSLDEGALFLVLAPNMCGCFIAGLLSTPAAAGVASDERYGLHALAALPPSHRLQALTRVHIGLRTGLCGALTTWASWNQEMTARAVQGDWSRALLGMLFGVQLSLASLAVGQHVAAGLWHEYVHPRHHAATYDGAAEPGGLTTLAGEPPPPPALSHPPAAQLWGGDVAAATMLCAAVAGCVAGLVQSSNTTAREVCLAALCGPFGVVVRWQLARWNGALRAAPWLPLGTLAANVAACVFDAALAAGYVRTRLARGAVWGGVLNAALQAGIGGGLSTVSTAVVEASLLFTVVGSRWRGYAYLLLTLVASYAPALAIYGGATRADY